MRGWVNLHDFCFIKHGMIPTTAAALLTARAVEATAKTRAKLAGQAGNNL